MSRFNRVEVPPNFGVNLLNLQRIRHGRISEIVASLLNPFNVVSRIKFRAAVDVNGLSEITEPYPLTQSLGSLVAFAKVGSDSSVSITSQYSGMINHLLPLTGTVSCFTFIGPEMLLTGTTSGDIELWRISNEDAKCLYKFNSGPVFPVHLASCCGEDSFFAAILSKGKCMLVFDTIACVSGNTDEALFSPVIVDLLQSQYILDCSVFNSLVSSVNGSSVHSTDLKSHTSASWNLPVECSKVFWAPSIGHLFAVAVDGSVIDCSWSNGLVGVSTMPSTNSAPSSVEKTSLLVNPSLVDLKHSILVTIIDNNLLVYSLKSSGNGQFPTFPIITEFLLDKQVPVNLNNALEETVAGITINDHKSCSIIISDPTSNIRVVRMAL
jgi:hypothetical protein